MGKIISVFSHKGGVGKTTFIYNLAYQLASTDVLDGSRKNKVLLIDTDSQMNLTASVYGLSNSIEYLTKHGTEWIKKLTENQNFHEFLKANSVVPPEKNDILDKKPFSKNLCDTSKIPQKLLNPLEEKQVQVDILSASVDIIQAESKLYTFNGTEDRPEKFQSAINKIAQNYDFVLIDTSPSAGSTMNGLIVFSSHYFITTATPTFFSLQAMDNMRHIIEDWSEKLKVPSSKYGFTRDVKFLGVVFQMAKRFKQRGKDKGKIDENFSTHAEKWMKSINQSVRKFQIEAQRDKWSIDEYNFQNIFGTTNEAFIIEKCCDFTPTLRSLAEEFGVPVLALKDISHKKISQSINLIQYKKALETTIESYQRIANGLMKL